MKYGVDRYMRALCIILCEYICSNSRHHDHVLHAKIPETGK